MIDERRLLERAAGAVPPPEHVMDALHRRRDRKLRNRRLGALALAACLTIALVIGVVQAIHGAERKQPASPAITPGNAASLQQIASDPLLFPIHQGFRTATGEGVLAMGVAKYGSSAGQLVVYPFPCAGADAPCTSLWRANLDGPGMPTLADGSVFVTGLDGDRLYAFATGCATDGSLCRPSWTAPIGRWKFPFERRGASQAPLVVTSGGTTRVYVISGHGVLGFDPDCATDGGRCRPAVSIRTDHPVNALSYANDLLFVGMGNVGHPDSLGNRNLGPLSVYSASCLEDRGVGDARCTRWSHPVGAISDIAVDASGVYLGLEGGGIRAYPMDCIRSGATCPPSWEATTGGFTVLTVQDGVVYADDQTQHAFAFPTSCSPGVECRPLWTSRGVLGVPFEGFARPVVSDSLVFVGGDAGWIYAYDRACSGLCAPSSQIFIADQDGGPGIWDATVSGNRLYVAAEDGLHVYAPGSPKAVEVPSAGEAPIFYLAVALVGGTLLALSIRRRRQQRL
jgi:outer membrane protein assembly factor BamB